MLPYVKGEKYDQDLFFFSPTWNVFFPFSAVVPSLRASRNLCVEECLCLEEHMRLSLSHTRQSFVTGKLKKFKIIRKMTCAVIMTRYIYIQYFFFPFSILRLLAVGTTLWELSSAGCLCVCLFIYVLYIFLYRASVDRVNCLQRIC